MRVNQSADGFSIVEALVASMLAATAIVGLVHLLTLGAQQGVSARRATTARVLAQSKLEQLRSLTWTYDAAGAPRTSTELAASPGGSLTSDVTGFFDLLDRFGRPVAAEAMAHFRRRWSIAPFAGDPDTLVLRVCVSDGSGLADSVGEACVWTVRTRRP